MAKEVRLSDMLWLANGIVAGTIVGLALGGGRWIMLGIVLGAGLVVMLWRRAKRQDEVVGQALFLPEAQKQLKGGIGDKEDRSVLEPEEARRWLDDFLVRQQKKK
jgi:hypothetical protein